MAPKSTKQIKRIIKDFHKGMDMIKEGEKLIKGLDSITYEVETEKPAMIKVVCDGWEYRIKAEDLTK